MNKKFFAALASATMAFSATGSLAVFAQDFVDETQQNVPGTGDNYSEVNLYDVMDYKLIDAVEGAYAALGRGDTFDPAHALKSQLDAITELKDEKTAGGDPTDYADALKAVEDFRGIEYLTKLTTFSLSTDGANATTVDLSENSKLTTVTIVSDKLADLELPVENTLTALTVSGDTKPAPIHKLDFRGFSETATAVTIDVNNTALVKADLSGVTALTNASFVDSPIFSVNVNGLSELTNLTVANTYLKKLDVTTNKNLTDLILNDNHLDELDLSNNKKLVNLNIDNNYFASIDLTNNKKLADKWAPKAGDANTTEGTGEQTLYTSAAYDTVDLTGLKGFVLKYSSIFADTTGTLYEGLEPVEDEDGEPTGVCKLTGTTHKYQYDGTGAFDADKPVLKVTIDNNAELMNRLYNPNSGEHFYTKDLNEKDVLTGLGWVDEGIGWVAPTTGANVYRLYNPNAGDHHYTTDLNEKTFLVAHGWKDEGIGWYSADEDSLPLFRQYNPNATGAGSHNYTTDVEENDFLVNIGWVAEGEAWYALK